MLNQYHWDNNLPYAGNSFIGDAAMKFPGMIAGVGQQLGQAALANAFMGQQQQPAQPNPYVKGMSNGQMADMPYGHQGYHTQYGDVMPNAPGFVPNGAAMGNMNNARFLGAQGDVNAFNARSPMYNKMFGQPGQGGYFGNILGNIFGGGGGFGGIKMTPIPVGFNTNFGGSGGVTT